MFFAKFKLSNLITYLGGVFGVLAMYFAFSKMAFLNPLEGDYYARYCLACLVIAGVCDMWDGKFARLFKRTKEEKEIGVQMDSLCDTLCFIAVPIVFMMSLHMLRIWDFLAFAFFAICGVSRLAYFNVVSSDSEKAIKTYQGLPVTSTAITFPLLGLFRNMIPYVPFKFCFLGLTIITGILFVVNIKIPKFKSMLWYILIPILAAILVTLLLVI